MCGPNLLPSSSSLQHYIKRNTPLSICVLQTFFALHETVAQVIFSMPKSTSESDTVSDSNSDSDKSIEKSSRKREKFSRKRVMADQEDGELRLPEDPQHVEEEVPNNDAQDEIPSEPKEPKRPKLDVDVTEFRVSSTSSKKIRKWISNLSQNPRLRS
jgi:hypothetical protein